MVQTIAFGNTVHRATWNFPPAGSYRKVLMRYAVKCPCAALGHHRQHLRARPQRWGDVPYEINRYRTPFGNFMDLGPNGVSWLFDVTDYAFLLHDAVDRRANPQEDLDVRFPGRSAARHRDRCWRWTSCGTGLLGTGSIHWPRTSMAEQRCRAIRRLYPMGCAQPHHGSWCCGQHGVL